MSEWFYVKEGKQGGPVSDTELDEMVTRNELPADTQVWKEGMSDWVPAESRHDLTAEEVTEEVAEIGPLPQAGKYQTLSILACLFCILNPFGAFAFVYVLQAKNAHKDQRVEDAQKKLALCKRMLILAFVLSAIIYAGVVALFMFSPTAAM